MTAINEYDRRKTENALWRANIGAPKTGKSAMTQAADDAYWKAKDAGATVKAATEAARSAFEAARLAFLSGTLIPATPTPAASVTPKDTPKPEAPTMTTASTPKQTASDDDTAEAALWPASAPTPASAPEARTPTPAASATPAASTPKPKDTAAPARLAIVSGAELAARKYPPRQFIVADFIQRGNLVLFAGKPKTGKSWILLQLAHELDAPRGGLFLNKPTLPAKVLYLALEDGERRIHERLAIRNWTPVSAHFYSSGMLPLDGGGMAQLRATAEDFDVVIVDSLRVACGAKVEENNNEVMGAILQALADYAHESGKVVIVVHHLTKASYEDAFDGIRGAGSIRQAYDVGVLMQRKKGEKEAKLLVESRDAEIADMTISFEGGTKGWKYEGDGERLETIRAGKAVVKALSELGGEAPVAELAAFLKVTPQAIGQQLKAAEREGLVTRRDDPDDAGKKKKPRALWAIKAGKAGWAG